MIKHAAFINEQDKTLLREKWKRAKVHTPAAIFLIIIIMSIYAASLVVLPGWLTYGLSFIALTGIGFTALARLDDISSDQTSKRWQVRRAGLVMVVAGAGMIALDPMTSPLQGNGTHFPTWNEVMIYWGMFLTWVTTPHMPPWWRYITGQYKTLKEAKIAAVSATITGLDPKEDAPQYLQSETIPPEVHEERRRGYDRRETGP